MVQAADFGNLHDLACLWELDGPDVGGILVEREVRASLVEYAKYRVNRYLIRRIDDSSNVVLRARTQIDALEGTDGLERIRWRQLDTGESQTRSIRHLFLMTGADPNTAWLKGCLALDDKNFVKTGTDLLPDDLEKAGWPLARRPDLLETSRPGIFAVGDVRSGSVKRVASAVGEGSVCVQLIHRSLREVS